MKRIALPLALLTLLLAACTKDEIVLVPKVGPSENVPDTIERKDPADTTVVVNPPDSSSSSDKLARWKDTGANVSVYPSYKAVSTLEDFPRIEIATDSGNDIWSKETYVAGRITLKDPAGMYSDVRELSNLRLNIRGRGNSTWNAYDRGYKNPYRLKLVTEDQSAKSPQKLFGMKGDSDWILLSDLLDYTQMRTALAFQISRLVSMPWTPDFRAAELYLNGDYQGLYLLVEHKEVDRKNKVPIEVNYGTVESGYLLELDLKSDSDAYFTSEHFYKRVKFKDPDPNDEDAAKRLTSAQRQYIVDYFNDVEDAMQSRDWDRVHNLIEMDSWIQNFFVHEISMNIDGNMRLSTYFAKDTDTKLFMPFVWDFDRAFGNASYQQGDFALPEAWPYGWFVRIRGGYPDGDVSSSHPHRIYGKGKFPAYYQYLFEDPVFVARVKELWALYRPRLDGLTMYLDKMVEYDKLALDHNASLFHSYASRVQTLRSDLMARLSWMDARISSLQPQRYNPSTGAFEDL